MGIAQLLKVLPAPKRPVWAPRPQDWARIEKETGINIPRDYVTLVTNYGAGCIDGFVWLFSPVIKNPHINLVVQLLNRTETERRGRELGLPVPYPLHPQPDCLVPWACTDNGDTLFWLGRGMTHHVIVREFRGGWEEFDMRIIEFLVRALKGGIEVDAFPDDWRSTPHKFTIARRRVV
jgi:hypothetical protein